MEDIDGRNIVNDSEIHADLVIVGAGAAGFAIARSFINTRYKVVIIESGDHSYNAVTQSLYEIESIGHSLRSVSGYISRNRYLGGSTNTWHGGCAPLNKIDFDSREWIANSGWPITRDELIPYYKGATEFLKLPDYNYFYTEKWHRLLKNPSVDFAADADISPEVFLFSRKPLNARVAYSSLVKKSKNLQIYLNSNLTNIKTNHELTNVTGLNIRTFAGNRFLVKAKYYILACGGWENARLLLLSRNNNELGLGNNHDMVGRYYNEHPKIMLGRLIPKTEFLRSPVMIWKRRVDTDGYIRVSLKLSEEQQRKHRLPNHYIQPIYPQSLGEAISSSDSFFKNLDFSKSSLHRLAKFSSNIFTLAESFERIMFNLPLKYNELAVVSHFEQIPNRDSRVSLSDNKDALGQNKLKVDLKISSDEKASMCRYHEVMNTLLQRHGFGKLETGFPEASMQWPGLTDSSHHLGTTRMSDDPKKGVVDKNCKVHSIANLFIASGSVFPTGGHVNPTYSIVAIALRLADHLKSRILQ